MGLLWFYGTSGGSYNSDKFLRETFPSESCLLGVPKKRVLDSCGSGFSSWFLGGVIWKKFRIPDSVLLVHSKIAAISDNNSDPNKNEFMEILSPLTGIKTLLQEVGGPTSDSHVFPLHSFSMLHLQLKRGGVLHSNSLPY